MPADAELIAVDTSVAIPLLVASHAAHADVVRWWRHRPLTLSGHALPETYSVLTRLPGNLRLAPADAARLLRERFASPLTLSPERSRTIADFLSENGVAGGAVYDALVALAAIEHDIELATRDGRARATYETLGVRVQLAG